MEVKRLGVDLGCGYLKKPDDWQTHWVGTDIRPFKGVDYVFDIGKDKFPFKDNSVDEIRAIHLLEHLYPEQLFHCMDEAFRILKPDGFFHVEVPIYGTEAWLLHPDHKMHWNPSMVGFFQVPSDVDRHGYLKGFWHIEFLDSGYDQHMHVNFHPNKPGNVRYGFKEVGKIS